MDTNNQLVDLSKLSSEQIEALLNKRKEKERKAALKARETYETNRDNGFEKIFTAALEYELHGRRFKEQCHLFFEEQAKKLEEYGDMPVKSKGGFTLSHKNGNHKARRTRQTDRRWDERAEKAIVLLKMFLDDKIKKRDNDTYDLLMVFIAKNKSGELDYAHVMQLIQHENKYTDPRWKEGLKLIKESYTNIFKAYGYEFETRDKPGGKFRKLTFNFSSI